MSVKDALGYATLTEYDGDGRTTAVIDPHGNRQSTSYDAVGRPVTVTDALGNTTRTEYDAVGNAVAQVMPSGFTVRAVYDPLNRQIRTNAGTLQTDFEYDALGQPTHVKRSVPTDANAATQYTRYEYDTLGRLTRVWDAGQLDSSGTVITGAIPTTYEYDARGNKTRVTDALGHTTETVYNLRNQPIRETDPEGGLVTFDYDAAGQLTDRTNGNADTQSYEYDVMGNVIALYYQEYAPPITYEYDLLGRLVSVRERTGVTEYEYDKLGRITSYRDGLGQLLQYEYDEVGRRSALVLAEGAWRYGYNEAGQMTSVTDPTGLVTKYEYNSDGQRTRTLLPYGMTKSNTYDPTTLRLTKQEYKGATGNSLLTLSYGYDGFNNVNQVIQNPGTASSTTTSTYKYDALNRLVQSILDLYGSGQDKKSTFEYDVVGNRTQQIEYKGTVSSSTWTLDTTHEYDYDDANRIKTETHLKDSTKATTYDRYLYDAAGRLLLLNSDAGTSKQYEYDALDRLTKVVSGSTVTTYRYDAEGRRLGRKTVDRTKGTSDAVYYQYDGIQAIAERDGAGGALALVTRGLGGELLTLQPSGSTPLVYLTDYLGSVIQLRNDQGVVKNTYSYDAFGNVTAATEGVRNDWKFTGANFDTATGLYHLSARYYAPADGRFITQDTYKGSAWAPWTQHLYAYVGNNPVNLIDPTGHAAEYLNDEYVVTPIPGSAGSTSEGPNCHAPTNHNQTYPAAECDNLQSVMPAVCEFLFAPMTCDEAMYAAGYSPEVLQFLQFLAAARATNATLEAAVQQSLVDSAVTSSQRMASSQITEGARAIAKKLGHAGGKYQGQFTSAFSGISPTQANAEALIRDIMSNSVSQFRGTQVWDFYNAANQGVRLRLKDGAWVFETFLEGALRTQ